MGNSRSPTHSQRIPPGLGVQVERLAGIVNQTLQQSQARFPARPQPAGPAAAAAGGPAGSGASCSAAAANDGVAPAAVPAPSAPAEVAAPARVSDAELAARLQQTELARVRMSQSDLRQEMSKLRPAGVAAEAAAEAAPPPAGGAEASSSAAAAEVRLPGLLQRRDLITKHQFALHLQR